MDGIPGWAEGDKAYKTYFEASAVSGFTPQETIKYDRGMMTGALSRISDPVTHFTLCNGINTINYARQEGEQASLQKGREEGERKGEDGRESRKWQTVQERPESLEDSTDSPDFLGVLTYSQGLRSGLYFKV